MSDQIFRLQFAADAAMATLIWLVQLVIYPAFREVASDRFADWHQNYVKIFSRIVIPLMFLQALSHGILSVMEPSVIQWLGSAAIMGAWMVTFTLSVPCHKKLHETGYQPETINRLIQTNWLRTILWSLTLILSAVLI